METTKTKTKTRRSTKFYVLRLIRNIFFTIMLLSPLFGYIGVSLTLQQTAPTNKSPYITWDGLNPEHQVYVSWETSSKGGTYVEYGTSPNNLLFSIDNSTAVSMHHIVLNNLTPGVRYYYRAGFSVSNLTSKIQSFSTSPNTSVPFNFTLISDTQQMWGTGFYGAVSNSIAKAGDTSFVVDVGDLGQEAFSQNNWNLFWKYTNNYTPNIPFVPVLGNHDSDANNSMYVKYFNVTSYNGTPDQPWTFYYSFNWSDTQFVVTEIADTGDIDPNTPYNQKMDVWLNNTLEAGQAMDYRVLFLHRQLYSSNGNDQRIIDRLMPIIMKYNVSLVFYGHQHIYERFLVENHTIVCLGGGGGMQNTIAMQQNVTQVIGMGPSITKVFVDGGNVTIKTVSPTGDVIDQVQLQKSGSNLVPVDNTEGSS